jgi:pseudouridine synthase
MVAMILYGAFLWILVRLPSSAAFSTRSFTPKEDLARDGSLRTTQVILYHKPVDVVTTHARDDILGRPNVYQDLISRSNSDDLPSGFPLGWHAVGRLDAPTSGLLLLTNDGGLVHHVTNPQASSTANGGPIAKTYEALVMGYHDEDSPMWPRFRQGGMEIRKNQYTLPVHDVQVLDHPSASTTQVSLTIVEGMNRQVRLMFHACGSGVMRLKRTAIGLGSNGFLLIDMVPMEGDWCFLTDAQVKSTLGWTCRSLIGNNPSFQSRPTLNAGRIALTKRGSRRPKRRF